MSTNEKDSIAADFTADLAALRDEVARLSEAVAGLARPMADAAGAALKGAAGEARDGLSRAAGEAQESAQRAAGDLERRIEKYPLTAVLIAAGVGMALGMMSKSRG